MLQKKLPLLVVLPQAGKHIPSELHAETHNIDQPETDFQLGARFSDGKAPDLGERRPAVVSALMDR